MQRIFFSGLLASVSSIIGSLLVLYRLGNKRTLMYRLMAFGSGLILGMTFLHLIPEAMARAGRPAAWGLMIGFAILFALEQVTSSIACPVHPVGLAAFVVLMFHGLIDGLVVAAGFGTSVRLGLVAAVAVIIHKIPEGVSLAAIALGAG